MTYRTVDECRRCERALVPECQWEAMSRAERRTAKHTGKGKHQARGLCQGCWESCKAAGTLMDYEKLGVPRDIVAEEWARLSNPLLTQAENARQLAPRLGMTPDALTKAVQRLQQAAA